MYICTINIDQRLSNAFIYVKLQVNSFMVIAAENCMGWMVFMPHDSITSHIYQHSSITVH